jgi:hypothetical protein
MDAQHKLQAVYGDLKGNAQHHIEPSPDPSILISNLTATVAEWVATNACTLGYVCPIPRLRSSAYRQRQ